MVTYPKEWKTYDFGEYFSLLSNNTLPRAAESEAGTVVNIHYGDVLVRYGETIGHKTNIPKLTPLVAFTPDAFLQSNDVIFADTAEDETVGKCTQLVDISTPVVAGLHTIPCRPRVVTAPGFLGYYLNSRLFHDQLIPYITGIKVSSISKASIQKTTLTLPDFPEQRAIADVLSGFDEYLANLDELIAKKKASRDGFIEELISGNRRLEGFTEDWASYSLGEIVTVRREVLEASIPDVDIELENLLPREGKLTGDISYRTAASLAFCSGDVLFGRLRPYLRKYWLADRSGVKSGEIWALVPGDLIVPLFLFHLVRSNQFISAANLTMGTKMPRADWQHMKDRVFRIPSIREQNAIAASLSVLDNEIEALSDERAKIERLKLGAMDDLLTGRVRLPIDEEVA